MTGTGTGDGFFGGGGTTAGVGGVVLMGETVTAGEAKGVASGVGVTIVGEAKGVGSSMGGGGLVTATEGSTEEGLEVVKFPETEH